MEKTEEIDSTALKIAILPIYDCIPFYYADEEGIFDSLGIKINLITYESSMDADTAFVKNIVDGVISDIVKASMWRSNGDSIKLVMSIDPELSLVTSKSARLFNTNNIKEKIIAITRHSILDFTTDKILESVKLKSEDLNKPQINNIMLRTKMTNQNQYDGALLPEPYATETTTLWGSKSLTSSCKLGLKYMGALLFNDSITEQRHNDIEKLVLAYSIAAQRLNSTCNYPLKYIPSSSRIEIPDSLFEYKEMKMPSLPTDSILSLVNQWLTGRKLINKNISYKSLIDTTFIKSK